MTIIDGLIILFSIIFAYYIIVKILNSKGILEKYNISLWGPALLLRTKRGRGVLKKIASISRFWKAYGSFAVVFCFIAMIFMTFVLIYQVWVIIGFTAEQKAALPGPEIALVLPGINPILPLEIIGYILLALAVAIIVHEFSHGILTFAGKLKVKSLGLLYLIVPLGAFCEPDEEELKKAETTKRMRVYAAGPLSNFVVAFICILLFSFVFMSAVQPAADGVVIVSVGEDSPAEEYGFTQGMIISSINDTEIRSFNDFFYVMSFTEAGQEVNVSYYWHGQKEAVVVFSDKYDEYEKRWPSVNNESFIGKGYFGVGPTSGTGYLSALKNPFQSTDHFLVFYILPLIGYYEGYNPIVAPFTESYVITGPLGILPDGLFWIIINALYWIFWLNLAVGLFNVLPMVPLDGGFLFNDAIGSIVKRFKKGISEEGKEKVVKNVSLVISLMILIVIILPFVLKYF